LAGASFVITVVTILLLARAYLATFLALRELQPTNSRARNFDFWGAAIRSVLPVGAGLTGGLLTLRALIHPIINGIHRYRESSGSGRTTRDRTRDIDSRPVTCQVQNRGNQANA
jgi:hypothetical protein